MMTSKYIGFFLKEISAWQKTLGVVDTVIFIIFLIATVALQIVLFILFVIIIATQDAPGGLAFV